MNHKPGSVIKSFRLLIYAAICLKEPLPALFQQSTRVYPAGSRQTGKTDHKRCLTLLLMRLAIFRLCRNLCGGVTAVEAGSYPAISPLPDHPTT